MGKTSRERQRAYREAHANDPLYHIKRSEFHRKTNLKRKLRRNVERTLKERQELKQALNLPSTNARNARKLRESSRALGVLMHFKIMLSNPDPETRFIAIAWFRVVRQEHNPYVIHNVPYPTEFDTYDLERAHPARWKFHSSDLTKNIQ